MKILGTALTLACTALVLAPWAVAGADPAEQITDVSGDAHGLTQPYHDGGVYGVATETIASACTLAFGGPDCTGYGTPIEPISYDQADILGVKIETLYEAIAVGDDGIDYRATGLGFTIRTTAVPRLAADEVSFRTYGEILDADCRLNVYVSVPPTGAPSGFVDLHVPGGLQAGCGDVPARTILDGSTAQVLTSPPGVRIELPYALFGAGVLDYLGPGVSIMKPWSVSRIHAPTVATSDPRYLVGDMLDKTPQYVGFYVGDDMPADVPCTKNCP